MATAHTSSHHLRPLHIRGVTGPNSSVVNGIWDPTDELSCGQPVYVKRGDGSKWIHFWSANGEWIVADTEDKGKNDIGFATLERSGRLEAAFSMSQWQVYDGKAFVRRPEVRVHVESAPLHIRGVTGTNSSVVNGIWDPTDELSCGQPVYVKRGDGGMWIHFWSANGEWIVADTEDKGKNSTGFARLEHSGRLEAAFSMSQWQVYDGEAWAAQPEVRVHVESKAEAEAFAKAKAAAEAKAKAEANALAKAKAAAEAQAKAAAAAIAKAKAAAEAKAKAEADALAKAKAAAEAQAKAAAAAEAAAKAEALAKAKAAAEAKAKADALAAEQAKYAKTLQLLKELHLEKYSLAFMSHKVTDKLFPATAAGDLVTHIGMTLGEATELKLAASSAMPLSSAGGGTAAAVSTVTGGVGSKLLGSPKPLVTSVLPVAGGGRVLASSNFKQLYEATEAPRFQDQLFQSLRLLLVAYCASRGAPEAGALSFFQDMQREAFKHVDELVEKDKIEVAATRIWTSAQTLDCIPGRSGVEFCSLLNEVLRLDDAALLQPACCIIRGINQLCVVRRKEKDQKFPPAAMTHRGGALPLQHLPFFTVGKKYRIPMFLATSFNEMKAYEFWYRKFDAGETPVHWVIHLDPAGQHNLMKRCKHVNLVSSSNVDGEEEFLFAPYSVFTVMSVHAPPRPTDADPIVIHITAAIDNRHESEDLPLAPWA